MPRIDDINPRVTLARLQATSQAQGDIIYFDGSAWVRLAKGSALQFLRTNAGATAPEWATLSTGITNTTAIAVQEKHWYKWNNATGDEGVEDDDLTATGATMVTTQKIEGTHAALFDADSEYFTLTADATWTPAAFTHNFWFYPTETPADWRALMGMNISGNAGYGSLRLNSGLNLELWTGNEGAAFITTSGGALTLNAWNMITITQTGNAWEVFINGVSRGTNGAQAFTDVSGQTIRLGARNAADRNARGYMDDFRVYNSVLTTGNIATLYAAGAGYSSPMASSVDILALGNGSATAYLWVDDTGDLRYNSSSPTRLRDGAVVGGQS